MEDLINLFGVFKANCDTVNNIVKKMNIPCIVEYKLYDKYNWFYGAFMTDKFGGIGAIIKYYNSKWYINDKECSSDLDAFMQVPGLMSNIYTKRDLNAIYEMVNDEY